VTQYRPLLVALFLLAVTVAPAAYTQEGLAEARASFLEGRYNDAIGQFTRLARQDPGSAEVTRGWIRALMEVGRYDSAEEEARRFIERNPESPELWNTLGEVLVLRGNRAGARTAFTTAMVRGASDSLTARLNLAVLRYESGELTEAMQSFDTFIDVYNRTPQMSSEELSAVATAVRHLGARDYSLFHDALRAYNEAIAADPDNIEPRLLVGDLFLEKYEGSEALDAFEGILARNPNHPQALLGLAQARRFGGSSDAVELLDSSLAVNPNLVAARTFRAKLLIEFESYEGAIEEIERALDVNPNDLDALAVQASIRFVQGDRVGFEETRSQVLALNPRFSVLYTTLAEISARNRLYHSAAEFGAAAVGVDSNSWRGYALLGINQLRIGDMGEGRENLETAFRGDPFDAWTYNTLDLLDTLQTYDESTTERFRIAIDKKESDVLSLYVGDVAEEAYEAMAARYGFQPATPLRVEVYPDHADFSVRTVGLTGLGALGVSFGPVIAMDSPSARDVGEFSWGSTLWHEIAHSFHMGLSDHRVPRWFTEGLAVWEEHRAREGWGDGLNPSFLMAYQSERLHPVSALNNGFMRPSYPGQIGFSYYQASLVCDLIERDYGVQAFADMLRAYGDGKTTEQVLQDVLGVGMDEFDEKFDEYLRTRFAGPLDAVREPEPIEGRQEHSLDTFLERAGEEPGDFAAQLEAGQALIQAGRLDEAETFLDRAKSLFPEYVGASSPYILLARIYRLRGELPQAIQELEELTQRNGDHYPALMELAALNDSLGEKRAAADALNRAMYVYPLEMNTHRRLAELSADLGDWQRAIRERRAVVALGPVDRAESLYQLARAYFSARDLDRARRSVLRALEIAPGFEEAQELLLEIHDARSNP